MVGEVTGVEVALQSTNREDQLRVLNLLLDLWVTEGADVDLHDRA